VTVSSPAPTNVPSTASSVAGAADPASAVRNYLAAAKVQDLQALSLAWGTRDGSARERMERNYLEKAEIVVVKCVAHDSYEIIGDAPGLGGSRVFAVSLKSKDLTRTTNFNVVPGPAKRWYVESVDMTPLQDFCNRR
jgi:hypothetical protein